MLSPNASQPSNKLKWVLYLSLISLRFFGAIYSLPGYIHPDEFFQGGQELFFGQQLEGSSTTPQLDYASRNVPWEFEPQHAVRSIVPPGFMTLVPLRLYASLESLFDSSEQCRASHQHSILWAESMNKLSGKQVLIIPRIFMTILSLIFLDGSLWILVFCKQREHSGDGNLLANVLYFFYQYGPPREVIVLASSWPCLVFGIRPFTNTLEAMTLSALLVAINVDYIRARDTSRPSRLFVSTVSIGIICSIGIFVRFTYAFFAFPAVMIWIWHRWKTSCGLRQFMLNMLCLVTVFLATSAVFVLKDSQYYSQVEVGSTNKGFMYNNLRSIAPLNAFLYNSKSTNLAEHGLHPRITHSLVNMPMLYGPLAMFWYASIFNIFGKGKHNKIQERLIVTTTCRWVVFFGVFILSCAPHQEPRFLLPCLVPLAFLSGKTAIYADDGIKLQQQSKPALLSLVWILFNFILYIFFGWLHQGGLIDTLLHIKDIYHESTSPSVFVYYKTYMPPSFLVRRETVFKATNNILLENQCMGDTTNNDGDGTCINNEIHTSPEECNTLSLHPDNIILDLQGNDSSVLLTTLQNILTCTNDERDNSGSRYLVTPLSIATYLARNELQSDTYNLDHFKWEGYNFHKMYTSPIIHVSTEDWPTWDGSVVNFLNQLQLVTYQVKCM